MARIGRRVLVVEDYEDEADSLAKILERFGYDVEITRDGAHAVASALRQPPDFVLLDLGLPGLDGFEVAAILRRHDSCRDTIIVVMTGYDLPEYRDRGRANGIDCHLVKPVDIDLLMALLSRLSRKTAPTPPTPPTQA